jgi:tetratricopeptide (TPR) repeat protein
LRRILTFDPDNINARMGLMGLYIQIAQPDLSLKTIAEVRAQLRTNAFSMPVEMQLVQTEANAYIAKGDPNKALSILENAQVRYPTNIEPFLLLSDYYLGRKDITNALKVVEAEMKALPASPTPLIDYARIKMMNTQIAEAIPYLDKALKLDGKNVSARFNRAVAHLQLKHFKEAESDYRELENLMDANKLIPQLTWRVAYGLHSIAFNKKDRMDTVKYGKEYLKLAPANAPEIKQVEDQMKQIKKGAF